MKNENDPCFDNLLRSSAFRDSNTPCARFFQVPELFTRQQSGHRAEKYGPEVSRCKGDSRWLAPASGADLAAGKP